MIDLRAMKDNPEPMRASQVARGNDPATVDQALAADERRRAALTAFETARAEQKAFSKTVGSASKEERPALLEQAKKLSENVKALEDASNQAAEEAKRAAMVLENLILDGVPSGGEDDYEVLGQEGVAIRDFAAEGFTPKDHLDLGVGPTPKSR